MRGTNFFLFPFQSHIISAIEVLSSKHSEFVCDAVQELLIRGCITERDSVPVYRNPLHVAVQGNSKRWLILNLSYLNKFIWKQSVK